VRQPVDGEAAELVRQFAQTTGAAGADAPEYRTSDGLAAYAAFEPPVDAETAALIVGARVSATRAVIFTYNGDLDDELHEQALRIFDSILVA
jgi:hypothetical protein